MTKPKFNVSLLPDGVNTAPLASHFQTEPPTVLTDTQPIVLQIKSPDSPSVSESSSSQTPTARGSSPVIDQEPEAEQDSIRPHSAFQTAELSFFNNLN